VSKPTKPVIHGRDHEHGGADPVRITWESTGGAGAGGAVLFDTYPQDGGYLAFDTDGGGIFINNNDTGDNNPIAIRNQDDGGIELNDEGDGVGINIQSRNSAPIIIQQTGSGDLRLEIGSGNLIVQGLPTSDPGVSGALWINSGALMVSP
jgi:hypothetical protein